MNDKQRTVRKITIQISVPFLCMIILNIINKILIYRTNYPVDMYLGATIIQISFLISILGVARVLIKYYK